jgi:hypothetical protein
MFDSTCDRCFEYQSELLEVRKTINRLIARIPDLVRHSTEWISAWKQLQQAECYLDRVRYSYGSHRQNSPEHVEVML